MRLMHTVIQKPKACFLLSQMGDGANSWINNGSVVYGVNCGVIGTLDYQIFCDDSMVPVYSYTIQVTM